jgi:hypothetical protein
MALWPDSNTYAVPASSKHTWTDASKPEATTSAR